MKVSVVIPAHDEANGIEETLRGLVAELEAARLDFEVVVVDDHSRDDTAARVASATAREPRIRLVTNHRRPGFGMAVRRGLEAYTGDAVAVVMADLSDDPRDVVRYFEHIERGAECVFGSRFQPGSRLVDYPPHKLVLNRLGNWFIRALFRHRLDDTTNAFKCYRREVIDGCQPLLSVHFNLTVELPLKAVIRGFHYEVIPIGWRNRTTGVSKLKIREMGSRYLFVIFYCFLERLLTGGDYHRLEPTAAPALPPTPAAERR
jgi:dolichol-phosphate mannosyltransferase